MISDAGARNGKITRFEVELCPSAAAENILGERAQHSVRCMLEVRRGSCYLPSRGTHVCSAVNVASRLQCDVKLTFFSTEVQPAGVIVGVKIAEKIEVRCAVRTARSCWNTCSSLKKNKARHTSSFHICPLTRYLNLNFIEIENQRKADTITVLCEQRNCLRDP